MEDPVGRLETQMVVLARRIENASRRGTIHSEMDKAAYLIARTLDQTGPLSVSEIARRLALDGSTVTRQLGAMESRGFVTRASHPDDGRAQVIALSTAGHTEMTAVNTARRERFTRFLHDWSADDIDRLGRLLERLNDSIEADRQATDRPADQPGSAPRAEPRSDHRRSVLPTRRKR